MMSNTTQNNSSSCPDALGPETRESVDFVRQLQEKLLALGEAVDHCPAADIEKKAKAISTLIASLEKADSYLRMHGGVSPGDSLSMPSRRSLLIKIKQMVDNGALNELSDGAHD